MSVFTEGCCHFDSATGAVRPPAEIVFTEGIGSDLTVLVRRDSDLVAILRDKYEALAGVLDERSRRRGAAVEATSLGYGGESLVEAATGISRPTIRGGKAELASGEDLGDRIRRPGAGRPSLEEKQPGLRDALERLVDPLTRGDPESPLRWTTKSKEKLSAALREQGYRMSATRVGLRLRAMGYSLRSVRKTREGSSHPDRNAQFEHINATAERYQRRNQPVISVDTKKKELVGDFKNGGKEWQPEGRPENVLVHDFPGDSLGRHPLSVAMVMIVGECNRKVGEPCTWTRSENPDSFDEFIVAAQKLLDKGAAEGTIAPDRSSIQLTLTRARLLKMK